MYLLVLLNIKVSGHRIEELLEIHPIAFMFIVYTDQHRSFSRGLIVDTLA